MKKTQIAVLIIVIISILAFGACSQPAPAPAPSPAPASSPAPAATPAPAGPAPIEFTVTANLAGKENVSYLQFWDWANRVQADTYGAIRFKYLGGPEVVPALEAPTSVAKGLTDIFIGTTNYYVTMIPEAAVESLVVGTPAELRKRGFNALMEEIYAKQNLHYLFNFRLGDFYGGAGIFVNKKVTTPEELKGLKLRGKPPEDVMVNTWGASTVMIQSPELHAAIERGLVDGAVFPAHSVFLRYSLQEVVDYWVGPTFFRNPTQATVNLDKWNSVPQDLKKIMLDDLYTVEDTWVGRFKALIGADQQKILAGGVERVKWSIEDSQRFLDKGFDASWASIIKDSPTYGPKLQELAGRMTAEQGY